MTRLYIRQSGHECDLCHQRRLHLILENYDFALYCNRCKFAYDIYFDGRHYYFQPRIGDWKYVWPDPATALDESVIDIWERIGVHNKDQAWSRYIELTREFP